MRKLLLIIFAGLILSGCFRYNVQKDELGQNWNEQDQKSFYYTSQGSQLLKYKWFLHLEQASSNKLFLDKSLDRFGYIPDPFALKKKDDKNSHLLPIGFVKDVGKGYGKGYVNKENGDKEEWIGLTCAACHTSIMKIGKEFHRIDGAPANADFYALISGLRDSLAATENDDNKFSRFALNVGDENGSLRKELKNKAEDFKNYVEQSTPAKKHEWGKARLDAVGLILNTVAHRLVPEFIACPDTETNECNIAAKKKKKNKDLRHLQWRDPVPPGKDNTHQPNAPVSYPFLWDTSQQRHNQWNGVSVGTLSRNTTEVLGVFATFDPDAPKKNSVKFGGLKKLQGLVANLRSPRWNNPKYNLPPIDNEKAGRGKVLYDKHCVRCHKVLDREKDQVRTVAVVLNGFEDPGPVMVGFEYPQPKWKIDPLSVGTDPAMAKNFVDHTFAPGKEKQLVHASDLIGDALTGVWGKSFFGALVYGGIEEKIIGRFSRITEDLEVYKARPLNGIWATAPFLHNGSVPNMEELLKPAADRVKIFCVGSRVFDPKTLGFESALNSAGECGENFKLDTSIEGNWNVGHDVYGLLEPGEIKDIIEFIKSE